MKKEDVRNSWVRSFVLVAFVLSPSADALAQRGQYGGWHMGPDMMGGGALGWFGGIIMLAFWLLVLVGLVFLIKWLIQATKGEKEIRPGGSRALDILKERYARGEIGKEEFEAKKKDIMT